MKIILSLLMTLSLIPKIYAQDLLVYERKELIVGNDTLRYRIMYPLNFDANKKYPLVLFLHGSGERGKDNEAQLIHGGKLFAQDEIRSNFQAIVIFPQCPDNDFWASIKREKNTNGSNLFEFNPNSKPTKPMELTIQLVKQTLKEKYIDKKRVYVGGLSMGGMGTFEILYRCPKIFAAAFPICGGGSPEYVGKYAKKVKFWVFHGAKDDVVLPEYSKRMVDAIKEKGGDVNFTIYPNANHNSWDSAFAEPNLFPWLFSIYKK
ncbi:MAG: prolyl oligopeptidase family serine peptidase [Bacteroidales bacterium]|nr:prolyl oligopeptidase family serine peptidase [Bacteroidales bacterium]